MRRAYRCPMIISTRLLASPAKTARTCLLLYLVQFYVRSSIHLRGDVLCQFVQVHTMAIISIFVFYPPTCLPCACIEWNTPRQVPSTRCRNLRSHPSQWRGPERTRIRLQHLVCPLRTIWARTATRDTAIMRHDCTRGAATSTLSQS